MEELVFLLIYSFKKLDYAFQKGFIGPFQKMFAILLLAFEQAKFLRIQINLINISRLVHKITVEI